MFYREIREPLCFAFLMLDGQSMMNLASAIEPLRAANRLLGCEAFRWELCSLDGNPVMASNGLPFPAIPVDQAIERNHAIFLCGGIRVNPPDERPYLAAMRLALRSGLAIGALSTASYLLASAGLLDGYRCTIHWENRPAFEEDFPNIEMTGNLFEIDRNRLTCSGGTAAMDMMLWIISDRYNPGLAQAVANQFHHQRIREADETQKGGMALEMIALPKALQEIVQLMQENLENPVQIEELANEAGLSSRHLERLFRQHLGMTPVRYYLSLRVDRAREMLLYTEKPIIEIAIAAGFASTSHFSKWFKEFNNIRPTDLRNRARMNRSQYQRNPSSEDLST